MQLHVPTKANHVCAAVGMFVLRFCGTKAYHVVAADQMLDGGFVAMYNHQRHERPPRNNRLREGQGQQRQVGGNETEDHKGKQRIERERMGARS